MIKAPFYPIVYVRGYAMLSSEVEETVADPYMGFNKGSTKVRQMTKDSVKRYIFESPLLRLMKDYQYQDIYQSGSEIPPNQKIPERSIWIYRYYEQSSKELGQGHKLPLEEYAQGLHDFIIQIRDRYCKTAAEKKKFKVYLVAHSMGGLIVRSYLQKIAPKQGFTPKTVPVDKVFTYATPHNGIDALGGVFNVPGWGVFNVKNFDRDYMAQYLGLSSSQRVDTLNKKFPEDRFFCLVGTDYRDYEVLSGGVRTLIGSKSDGLVRIDCATVQGCPRAFVYRSHSGHYGIVNSESAYQNMRRFLFGDMKVEVQLAVKSVPLPKKVEKALKDGKKVNASYNIETISGVRGAYWQLHRRNCREESAMNVSYERMVKKGKPITIQTSYLTSREKTPRARGLAFSMEFAVMLPDYYIDGFAFLNEHFEGCALFRDTFFFEVGKKNDGSLVLYWGRQSEGVGDLSRTLAPKKLAGNQYEYRIPVVNNGTPGIDAELILIASPWNTWH